MLCLGRDGEKSVYPLCPWNLNFTLKFTLVSVIAFGKKTQQNMSPLRFGHQCVIYWSATVVKLRTSPMNNELHLSKGITNASSGFIIRAVKKSTELVFSQWKKTINFKMLTICTHKHMRHISNVTVLPWSNSHHFVDLPFSSDLSASLYGRRVRVVQQKFTSLCFVSWLDTSTRILRNHSKGVLKNTKISWL